MTLTVIATLLVAGLFAGLLSSMAGLASLVSYPVLLALGVPPVSANVTNTAALVFNGIGSAVSSRHELHRYPQLALQVTAWALAGGLVGSLVLAFAPASSFEKVVPFLILLAGFLMLGSMRVPTHTSAFTGRSGLVIRDVAVFLVGVYIGYFGASAGVIMLAILSLTLPVTFAETTAIKNFAALCTNLISLVIYAFTTKIYWLMVIPLGIGMFGGGLLGPIVVRHVPAAWLRIGVAIAAFGLAAYLFYTAYLA
ncbi:sulfite exporter TauE/SafE family protein [Lacticaseibacillus parakribbianus]|uniref:sulfite exporter TauE/SafE family protein n=1 Tax=Lacticaseibacillus parakribbianus TaxID=2970927 RepID=UPI0021CB2F36|nr:sulfite exporter TauE/SafE family protein [Lacticaseibacillus parakribbianus]